MMHKYYLTVRLLFLITGLTLQHLTLLSQTQIEPGILAYTTKDGLASNVIYRVDQDSKGYLWMGTQQGFCRFDGSNFDCYGAEIGLPDPEVLELLIDRYDRKWLSSIGAPPMYLQHGILTPYSKFELQSPDNNRYLLTQDSDFIYLFGEKTMYRIDQKSPTHIDSSSISSSEFFRMRHIEFGRIFKGEGLLLKAIIPDISLFSIDSLTYELRPILKSQLSDLKVRRPLHRAVHVDPQSRYIFIMMETGLAIFRDLGNGHFDRKIILDGYYVNAVFFDRDNNMWISTRGNGLLLVKDKYKYMESIFEPTDRINRLDHKVKAIASNDDHAFILTSSNKLYSCTPNLEIIEPISFEPLYISAIELSEDNTLFILAHRRLWAYNTNNLSLQEGTKIQDEETRGVLKHFAHIDSSLSFLLSNKIYRFDHGLQTRIYDIGQNEKIYASTQVNDSTLWLGTTRGLYTFNFKSNTGPIRIDNTLNGWVQNICRIDKTSIAVATKTNGLRIYADQSTSNQQPDTILLSDVSIAEVVPDSQWLWVGTSNGLYQLDRTDLSVKYWFNSANELPDDEVQCLAKSGHHILVGTYSGLQVLIDTIQYSSLNPIMDIQAVLVNDQAFKPDVSMNFPSDSNSVEVQFAGIYFGNSNITFEYQLQGHDTKVFSTQSRQIHYSQLPPGNYTFTISAVLPNNQRSERKGFSLRIRPPWWRTWWFYTLSVSAIILGCLFLWYDLKRRNAVQLQLLQSRLSTLHAQMNPHFLFNGLQSLQYHIHENKPDKAISYLTTFASFVRKTLETSRNDYIRIQQEVDYLTSYLALENEKRDNQLIYSIIIEDPSLKYAFIPSMIVQPFVENALVHGLFKQGKEQRLRIEFKRKSASVCECAISDNGIGINATTTPVRENHKSFAIAAVKQKLHLIQKLQSNNISAAKSYVQIEDNGTLKNAIFASGTTVKLTLPLKAK